MKKFLLLFFTILIFSLSFSNTKANEYNFTFSNYDVNIEVNKKGIYTITETIDVDFNKNMHGIYLNIPSVYKNVKWNIDDKTITKDYKFPINEVKVLSDHSYEIDYQSNGVSIKLGDKDYYAKAHEKYIVSYKLHSRDLGLNGIQTFYYNIINTNWDTEIYNSTFTIKMPEEFDVSKLSFTTDGTNVDPLLKYEINKNTITGSLPSTITRGRGITIKLDLPSNYFDFSTSNTPLYIFIGISILLFLLFIHLFNKYGRDDEIIPSVQIEAPDNLNSAECDYILNNQASNKGLSSLFIYWANKGYINIEDSKKELKFIKINEIDYNAPKHEKYLFNALFKSKSITSKKIAYEYDKFQNAKVFLTEQFLSKEKKLYTDNSSLSYLLSFILCCIPLGLNNGYYMYHYEYYAFSSILVTVFTIIPLLVSLYTITNYIENKMTYNFLEKFISITLFTLLITISFIITLVIKYITSASNLVFILWIITLVNIFITCFMMKRSKYGVNIYGKILGLKDFILHAESDRINALFEENPKIYFDIFPYAYVFGLTHVWEKHFKDLNVTQPTWYHGSSFDRYVFNNTIISNMNTISNPIPEVKSSSNTSGSFSSFNGNGGGFSGGGFGGSSGGGW